MCECVCVFVCVTCVCVCVCVVGGRGSPSADVGGVSPVPRAGGAVWQGHERLTMLEYPAVS